MKCPICEGVAKLIGSPVWDDRYAYPGRFSLMKCQNCEHTFLDCNLTPAQLGELYTNYYPRKAFDVAQFVPHTEKFGLSAWFDGLKSSAFRWVGKNSCVLDVGCGFGQSLAYHVARGCDVYGVEADENIRRVADKFGYKVHVGLFDTNLYEPNFFDYVTMDQVIEHVADPVSVLYGIARILKSNGTVILSTPNAGGWGAKFFGRRWINWHAPYHMQFFSQRSMRLAAEQAGLVVEKVKTITNSEWLYYQWIHLAMYPKLGEPSRFWSNVHSDEQMSLLSRVILRVVHLMHRIKTNHLVTRIFDGLGLGDSYVFVLKKP